MLLAAAAEKSLKMAMSGVWRLVRQNFAQIAPTPPSSTTVEVGEPEASTSADVKFYSSRTGKAPAVTADTGSAQVPTVGERPNVLVLEGILWWYYEDIRIGGVDLGVAFSNKFPDEKGDSGKRYRFTIERLE